MKLRNKLILSCAALAAVATTAVSTTFAWYTANDSVKATGITGKTSEQDATLLLISRTAKVGSWGASVEVDSSAVTLEPVAYSSGSYYPWVSNTNTVDTNPASGGLTSNDEYISFYLYFKSGSSEDLTVQISSFELVNTTAEDELPTFSVLAAGTGVTASSYSVNMFRALDVAITVEQGTEVASTAASPTIQTGSRTVYNCDALATGDNVVVASANAHTYYNNVKSLEGDDAIDDTKVASETTYTSIETLTAGDYQFSVTTGEGNQAASGAMDNILMVRFDIYLDGWDKMCFDAVRKQAFTLDMEFSAVTD